MAADTRVDDAALGEGRARLDDAALGERLARLDALLGQVEQTPGRTARAALEAVQALTALYGEALARVMERAGPPLAGELLDDDLVGHLLVLHGLHPEAPERRAEQAVARLRPAVRERGGEVDLLGIQGGVARVRLRAKGCGSSAGALEEAVREAVLAAAPELSEVRVEPPEREAAFVPLGSVLAGGAAGRPS